MLTASRGVRVSPTLHLSSYCYIVTTWTGYLGISLDDYPVVKAYQERCKALPFVASAHALMATSPATTNA
jgi:hypothetical protein